MGIAGLTSGLGGDKGGWREQRGRTADPDSSPSFRCPLATVPRLKEVRAGVATPSLLSSTSPSCWALRRNTRVFASRHEGPVPLPSLPRCSVQVEAGRFSAEALTADACLAVVRNIRGFVLSRSPSKAEVLISVSPGSSSWAVNPPSPLS